MTTRYHQILAQGGEIMKILPPALAALGAYKQFINYKLVPRPDGSMNKVPLNPHTGGASDAHRPEIWVSFQEAQATGLPVGFVFTAADPFFFLDVDHCKDDRGVWTNTATALCNMFTGCAVEISQSGEGLHIFGRMPENLAHGSDCKLIGSQFYTEKRFVALTGTAATGDANFTPPVETYRNLVNSYFPPKMGPQAQDAEWTTEPVEEYTGPEDDQELIKKMLKSKSGRAILGGAASVQDLWDAAPEPLGKQFPDDHGTQGRAFDWSLADAALCNHLAFWTGKDCERIQRIFEMSALAEREKWAEREAYRVSTILGAVAVCKSVYNRPKKAPLAPEPGPVVDGVRTGWQIRTVQDQVEAFRGCVYVRDIHRIFTPDGALLKPEQFRAVYGGYSYGLDATNEKVTKNAWEAFTESQAYSFPKAHKPCFRPELEPGAMIEHEGGVLVNTYVPIITKSTPGDPAPFLGLLGKLLPDPADQGIILAYMAACVQYKGVKFQWAPLLQGLQGNGKSFLGSCLTFCIGEKYTHLPDPKDLASVFNAWLQGKLLIVVDEVHTKNKVDVMETLKWMITNLRVPSQAKGGDQDTGDNRANFFMCTNHKDAIRKTQTDRRFCVFYTAQQEAGDLAACGMTGGYFPALYKWARTGGFAIINNFLQSYQIPAALNPAKDCHRAPVTSTTQEVLVQSLGSIEQEIIEAVNQDKTGFSGGWVSSMALDKLIEGMRIPIPRNKRRDIMRDLGYVPHPFLRDGRVNNVVPLEGGKPRLYIIKGHLAQNVNKPADIVAMYCKAQGYTPQPAQAGQQTGAK